MGKVSGALEGKGRWHLRDLYHFCGSLWKWRDSPSVLPEMYKYSSPGHVVTPMDLPSSPALYHRGLHPSSHLHMEQGCFVSKVQLHSQQGQLQNGS